MPHFRRRTPTTHIQPETAIVPNPEKRPFAKCCNGKSLWEARVWCNGFNDLRLRSSDCRLRHKLARRWSLSKLAACEFCAEVSGLRSERCTGIGRCIVVLCGFEACRCPVHEGKWEIQADM